MMTIPNTKVSITHCGIKKNRKPDIALILFDKPVAATGVFTTNKFKAAPVKLCETHLSTRRMAQALLVNSGNANAATGKKGERDTLEMAELVAKHCEIDKELVLIASTGIIGEHLPMEKVSKGIRTLIKNLNQADITKVAEAMMTTDTFPKTAKAKITLEGTNYHIWGIAKGAGMIAPNMATMLCFLFTNIPIPQEALSPILRHTVEKTFNNITIDGDMSTNDSVILFSLKSHTSPYPITGQNVQKIFSNTLLKVASELASQIIFDGEGATKAITITLKGAERKKDAKTGAMAVANSLLFKTAMFGGDANWGRIIAAIGACGIQCNPEKIDITINKIPIVQNGLGNKELKEKCSNIIKETRHIDIDINLHIGKAKATILTTDLSPEYVKINSFYHT